MPIKRRRSYVVTPAKRRRGSIGKSGFSGRTRAARRGRGKSTRTRRGRRSRGAATVWKKLTPPQVWSHNGSLRVTSVPVTANLTRFVTSDNAPHCYFSQVTAADGVAQCGTQAIMCFNVASQYAMQVMATQAAAQYAQVNSITSTVPIDAAGYFKSGKFLFHSQTVNFTFTNNSKYQALYEIYEFVARCDLSETDENTNPITAWSQGLLDNQANSYGSNAITIAGQMAAVFDDAEIGQTPAVVTPQTIAVNNIQARPFNSPLFCSRFKITKVRKGILDPGVTSIHRVKYAPNKIMSMEKISRLVVQRGVNRWFMIVAKGQVGQDTANRQLVTTAPVNLDCMYSTEFRFRSLTAQATTYQWQNCLPVISNNGAFGGRNMLDGEFENPVDEANIDGAV